MDTNRSMTIAQIATWFSYVAFLVTLLTNGLDNPWPIQLLTLAPLLIFLPGMLRQNHKTLAMLCFVCLMYFTLITVNLFEPHGLLDVLEMVWVVMLFIAAMLFSRWKQRSLYNHQMEQGHNPE